MSVATALLVALVQTSGAVSGTVRADSTEAPIGYASVEIVELDRGVSADEQGNYRLSQVPFGSWTLRASALGYTPRGVAEAAADGQCQVTFDGDFVLARSGCYKATLPQPVAPLQTYTLDIQLPGGGSVTAQTTTPAPPDFRTTTDTVVALYMQTPDNFPIAIAPTEVLGAPGATRVDVAFSVVAGVDEPESCVPDAHVDPYLSPALVDSHDFYFWGLECLEQPMPWDVLDLLLHAAAYDANYAAYLRTALEGNAFSSADGTFGLTGAVGVFGSAAVTTEPLVLAYRPLQLFPSDGRYASR